MTDRQYNALAGMIFVLGLVAVVVLGAKLSYGAGKPVYHLEGTFTAAGQGLLSGSDVKIHGVNIGKVSTIKLVDGKARIRLTINKREKIPVDAAATIRPKTLFGEKFVDIDPGLHEADGPFLEDDGVIANTLGGFEVERVLADLYPVLQGVKPSELGTILTTLARGGQGTGLNVNNSLRNLATIASAQAGNVAETQRFIDDLAALSDTLAAHADEAAAGIRDGHTGLKVLNEHADDFDSALKSLSVLSGDVADLLENNKPLLNKLVPEGGKAIDALDAQKQQLPGVITGLRQFLQTLAEAGTGVPYGDGALAKIKLVLGGSCVHAVMDCSVDAPPGYRAMSVPVVGDTNLLRAFLLGLVL